VLSPTTTDRLTDRLERAVDVSGRPPVGRAVRGARHSQRSVTATDLF